MESTLSDIAGTLPTAGRVAWLLLLGMLVLELLPGGSSGWWILAGAIACCLAFSGVRTIASAVVGGGVLGALALVDTTSWIGSATVLVGVAALRWTRTRRLVIAICGGMGIVFPALLLGLIATNPDARHALGLGIRLSGTLVDQSRTVLATLGVIGLTAEALQWVSRDRAAPSPRWAQTTLSALWGAGLVAWLAARSAWIASVVTLRTDMLIWSERPLLVNLLKLRAGETFYGPRELVNSYSYSPGLELLQYTLLRPWGLELELSAHRLLGLLWQLTTSFLLVVTLVAALRSRLGRGGTWFVALATLSVACSSLLAPHVHPDHAMLVWFGAAAWLAADRAHLDGCRAALLVAVPVFATVFKLTGAGVGLGLVLVYSWERDYKRLLLLALGGALALGSIPLFDATLGSFSHYAMRLQASHPMHWERVWTIPTAPAGKIWAVSLATLAARSWVAPQSAKTRQAQRVALVTLGLGLTSLLAYVKQGGRENSLMPLAIGGFVTLLLCALAENEKAGRDPSAPPPTSLAHMAGLALSVALVTTPPFQPIIGTERSGLVAMHGRQVRWLESGQARKLRFWSSSIAAYLDAGLRAVPRDTLSAAVELKLGHDPAFEGFARRIGGGFYDGLAVPNSLLFEDAADLALARPVRAAYHVVGPPELNGAWPKDRRGYVLLERGRR